MIKLLPNKFGTAFVNFIFGKHILIGKESAFHKLQN